MAADATKSAANDPGYQAHRPVQNGTHDPRAHLTCDEPRTAVNLRLPRLAPCAGACRRADQAEVISERHSFVLRSE